MIYKIESSILPTPTPGCGTSGYPLYRSRYTEFWYHCPTVTPTAGLEGRHLCVPPPPSATHTPSIWPDEHTCLSVSSPICSEVYFHVVIFGWAAKIAKEKCSLAPVHDAIDGTVGKNWVACLTAYALWWARKLSGQNLTLMLYAGGHSNLAHVQKARGMT